MRILALFILPWLVEAQTLQDVLTKVGKNDLVKSLEYAEKAQEHGLQAIKSAYMPKLEASSMYSYIDEDQRGLFDPELSNQLEASVVLFDGFRRYNSISAQKKQVGASREQTLHQTELLSFNAVKLYFGILTLKSNIIAKEQKHKQLQEEVHRLEQFFQVGSLSEDKVEQIKAAYAFTQYELVLLKQKNQEMQLTLATLTGEVETAFDQAHFKKPAKKVTGTTHELKATQFSIDALSHNAKTKTAGYWPTLLLKDTFSNTLFYESNLALPAGMELTLPETTNKIEVVAQMKLWDFFSSSNEKSALLLQKKAKEEELNYKKRTLKMQQKLASMQIDTGIQKMQAAEQSLKSSQKSYHFIKERFSANLVDNVTYLDALSTYTEAQAMLAASQNDYEVALANYYFQHGIPLKEKLQ